MDRPIEVDIVDNYLRLCEERDLEAAGAYLAPGAKLTFPGGVTFEDLPNMVADAAKRYKRVAKHRTEFFVGNRTRDGKVMCISSGTLDGETLWGTSFTGVRYLDLFIIHDGLIHEQYVWNDLSEAGVVPMLVQRIAVGQYAD